MTVEEKKASKKLLLNKETLDELELGLEHISGPA